MKKFSRFCSKSNGSAVKRFAEILLIVVALVAAFALFAACNGGSGSAPSTDGGTGSAGQTTVGQIYLESGVSLDRQALLENETQEIAVSAFGEGSTVLSFGIEQGTLFVISLNGGALSSVVVSLPEEVVDIINDELSSVLLKEANLTQNQTVSASEKEQVKQKLFDASQSVQSQIGEVSSLTYGTQNSYITGSVRQNGSGSVSVLGAVRSDGSVLLFDVLSDGKLSQSVFKIENAQSMTEDELWQAVTDGSLQPASQSDIDLSAVYAPPAVEEKITISEIYDQNFADIDFSAQLNNMFVGLLQKGFTQLEEVKVLAYTLEDSKLNIYYEMTRNSLASFNKLSLAIPEIVNEINTSIKDYILQQLGYSADTEVDKESSSEYVSQINQVVQQIESEIMAVVDQTNIRDMSNTTYGRNGANAPENVAAFGEALLEDMGEQGDIIATYVGDDGPPIIDQGKVFDAGYISNLNIVVVYENGNCIIIDEFRVTVPVYANERGDSQAIYQHVLQEGERGYSLQNRTTVEKYKQAIG